MTQIPIFITSRKAHYQEAMQYAKRMPHYTEAEKKQTVPLIIQHLKAAIESK